VLVLVPRCDSAARLLEQSLIVIDADAIHTEQIGRDPGESARQDKSPHSLVFWPQIHTLQECFAVGVAILHGSPFGAELLSGREDDTPVSRHFFRRGNTPQEDVAVALELSYLFW
jgi:hypothetical protein